jgi:hypothetical protein
MANLLYFVVYYKPEDRSESLFLAGWLQDRNLTNPPTASQHGGSLERWEI